MCSTVIRHSFRSSLPAVCLMFLCSVARLLDQSSLVLVIFSLVDAVYFSSQCVSPRLTIVCFCSSVPFCSVLSYTRHYFHSLFLSLSLCSSLFLVESTSFPVLSLSFSNTTTFPCLVLTLLLLLFAQCLVSAFLTFCEHSVQLSGVCFCLSLFDSLTAVP